MEKVIKKVKKGQSQRYIQKKVHFDEKVTCIFHKRGLSRVYEMLDINI